METSQRFVSSGLGDAKGRINEKNALFFCRLFGGVPAASGSSDLRLCTLTIGAQAAGLEIQILTGREIFLM